MAPRSKKEDTGSGELMVSIEQYTRTRDTVVVALTNLQTSLAGVQNGLNHLLRAYMQHTQSVVAGEDADFEKLQLPAGIAATANAVMDAATGAESIAQAITASSQPAETAAADGTNKKRKREKKIKDPNAPKKPLTAAFLYAQTARPIVRADLESALAPGQVLEKNAVNLEVTKRWNELSDEEKERWKASYRESMEAYKLEMAEYVAKAGGKVADVHVDEDMSDEGEAEIEVDAEAATIDSDASSDDEEDVPTKAPSPPAKTPRANKRQKTAATANGAIAPPTSASTTTPVPIPGGRTATQVAASTEAPATAKKDTKKKAKGAAPIAPAPASSAEPVLEEASKTTKKAKTGRSTRNAEADVDKENAATPTQDKEKKKRDRSKRKSEVASA